MNIYENIREKGVYYNPANKHYKGRGTVSCDKCNRDDLPVCIGWKNNDLCLDCVNRISKISKKPNVKKTSINKKTFKSIMTQRSLRRNTRARKRMRQRQFRK